VQSSEVRSLKVVLPEIVKRLRPQTSLPQILGELYPVHDSKHPEPNWQNLQSQVCTVQQCEDPQYLFWCDQLKMAPVFHRKRWEYAFILQALKNATDFRKGAKGIGFGVGKEPLVPYFAMQGMQILATDLAATVAAEKGWADTNQYAFSLSDYEGFGYCGREILRDKVELRTVDMNHIPEDLKKGEFDFCWSACALEHLGGIEQGLHFIKETLKCVQPGGVLVHTTELNIGSLTETLETGPSVLFLKKHIEDLAQELRAHGHQIDLNFNLGSQWSDLHFDVPPYADYSHLKLELEKHITTSIGLIIRKAASQ
jgi:SAM-dependent methyltransferase